jgi:hypothetical protein
MSNEVSNRRVALMTGIVGQDGAQHGRKRYV